MGELHDKYYMTGGSDVNLERQHQADLGYDLDHDYANHAPEVLLRAGACYIDFAASGMEGVEVDSPHPFFPESLPWKPEDTAIKNAIKGGAFVMSALDLIHVNEMEAWRHRVDEQTLNPEEHTHE